MKVFVTGEYGRPHAIERSAWAFNPEVELVHYPNKDTYDPLRERAASPFGFSSDDYSMREFYRMQMLAITRFQPDLLITCFLDDAAVAGMQEAFGGSIPTFCVPKKAARLEKDRFYSRAVCEKYGVSASKLKRYAEKSQALEAIATGIFDRGAVVKVDNGSVCGVYAQICHSRSELTDVVQSWPTKSLVIESLLSGIEIAFSAMIDYRSEAVIPMTTNFEYSKLLDGDRGPETGEMGSHDIQGVPQRIIKDVFQRLMPWFVKMKYVGFFDCSGFYNVEADEFTIYEFMTRVGSSELENICAMLGESFHAVVLRLLKGTLSDQSPKWKYRHSISSSVKVPGYPVLKAGFPKYRVSGVIDSYVRGIELSFGLAMVSREESVYVGPNFMEIDGQGTHFAVGASNSVVESMAIVDDVMKKVRFPGMMYRSDIGTRYKDSAHFLKTRGMLP